MNRTPLLFLNVLIIAVCGLVYELLAGTLASYVLGDSVTQFSFVIGIYLFAMGVGAWVSRFVDARLARCFIEVELGVALLGGTSAPLLFLAYAHLTFFHVILYATVFLIGLLVGLELPLLMRILREHLDFKELVSRVLTFDYIGALVASILFPIFFIPRLGLIRTSLFFGLLNALVGLWGTWLLKPLLGKNVFGLRLRAMLVLLLLAVCFIKARSLTILSEHELYMDEIVYARDTPYQRIVITRNAAGFQLYLNGHRHLQFNSLDEYRYHEALVHPAMAAADRPRRVLILGGGDGLALREVLRYPTVRAVTLVDLDPDMTRLSERFPPLAELNQHAFEDQRVTVINEDAMIWLKQASDDFDAVIIDFPDPATYSLGKLYTTYFYRLLKRRMTPMAAVGIQCTSPLVARRSYWCIIRTLEAAGFHVHPYHAAVPSFGIWGFAVARLHKFQPPTKTLPGLRFLNDRVLASLFVFPRDLAPDDIEVEVNRLDNQVLVRYHDSEWRFNE
ncbi:MAG: polyamine aminopropyltransferase [Gemmatales bacterium]|nr:MAG: polyamine aminopropyltransferase [Gemmatales bacterium]